MSVAVALVIELELPRAPFTVHCLHSGSVNFDNIETCVTSIAMFAGNFLYFLGSWRLLIYGHFIL